MDHIKLSAEQFSALMQSLGDIPAKFSRPCMNFLEGIFAEQLNAHEAAKAEKKEGGENADRNS